MPFGDTSVIVTVPRSELSDILRKAVRLGDSATCATVSALLDSTTGDRVRVEVVSGMAKPAPPAGGPGGTDANPSAATPDASRDHWGEWVALRDGLDALLRDKARGYAGAARCDARIEAARAYMEAFVRGLVDAGTRSAVPAPTDEVDPDRLCVMRRTLPLPTPRMMRSRLEADGWKRHETDSPGVSAYTLIPPGFETEFELLMDDEATPGTRWQGRVEQALRTLAGLEERADEDARDRPIGDLAADIVAEALRRGVGD